MIAEYYGTNVIYHANKKRLHNIEVARKKQSMVGTPTNPTLKPKVLMGDWSKTTFHQLQITLCHKHMAKKIAVAKVKGEGPVVPLSSLEQEKYQSPNANSNLQTLLQTSRYSANKIDKDIIA